MNFINLIKNKVSELLGINSEGSTSNVANVNNSIDLPSNVTIKKENATKHCNRCGSLFSSDSLYCEKCNHLKGLIEQEIEEWTTRQGNIQDTYGDIKRLSSYDYSKLDIENAEITNELSGVEKEFLIYLDGKSANNFELAGYWTYQHFIDCNYLISKFIKNNYLEIANAKSLTSMGVDELKTLLKKASLKVTGTKEVLIERIKENLDNETIYELAKGDELYFKLTDKGEFIRVNNKAIIAKDADFENDCYALILNNKIDEAYSLMCNYENEKLVKRGVSNSGIGCNWENSSQNRVHLHIDTKLPFKLPDCLKDFECSLKASAIYCLIMGANAQKAVSFFYSKNPEYQNDRALLKKTIFALCILAQGSKLPESYNFENLEDEIKRIKSVPKEVFEDLSEEKFIDNLKIKLQDAMLDLNDFEYDRLKDGTLNFTYKSCQIGRIKFGKRSSKMQILKIDIIECLENETMETYLNNIDKWIEYTKFIEKTD